jgi:hypothetical protein
MLDFEYRTEITINASPESIYDIVSNFSRHQELAGSGEIKTIRQVSRGPFGVGSTFEAGESVRMAGGQSMDLKAVSIVVTHDRPRSLSWVNNPAVGEQVRRIQWWFNLEPQGSGTRVMHEVEVDWGNIKSPQLQGLRDNYEQVRAGIVRDGMRKTLDNLKRVAEQRK